LIDWVKPSRRTSAFVGVAMTLFAVGAMSGLLSGDVVSVFDYVCDAGLFSALMLSLGVTLWSAFQCDEASLLRRGWITVSVGYLVILAVGVSMALGSPRPPTFVFNGASPMFTVAMVVIGCGLWMCALSVGGGRSHRRELFEAASLASIVFLLMLFALMAPGPSMPFSIGPRDGGGVIRLLLDTYLLLLPMMYATVTQLSSARPYRVQAWVAASGGALMICMGDVANPLVDLGHGQIYSVVLWCLGFILLTAGACLIADSERAEKGLDRRPDRVSVADVSGVDG
jgi:hypothetical protein